MYLSVSGDAVSQFKRQKKLVSDPLGLTEKVLKIVDTDVWDLPAPGSSGIHTLKWESGGEALIGDAATRQTRYAFRHHMFSDTICFQGSLKATFVTLFGSCDKNKRFCHTTH